MAIYLTEDEVGLLIDMPLALAAVESAFMAEATGDAIDVPRQRTRLPQVQLHLLQGALPGLGVVGFKAYTSSREGVRFQISLFDANNGRLLAMMAADRLGMMRTGAAAGVATRALARADAEVLGLFGAGWQAEGHLAAVAAVRRLRQVKVFARRRDRLEAFCARMSEQLQLAVEPAPDAESTVRGSDIIGTVTTSPKPLFSGEWLEPGTHINAAGSNALIRQEIDETSVRRADLVCVDSLPVALNESGDLFPLLEKGRLHPGQLVPLARILAGKDAGRRQGNDITLFESQGMAIQDLALAVAVLHRARERGLGRDLPFV